MPPKKLENNRSTNAAAALAACEDLMLCILARLPLKSILRFKSVCKSWNHLLSTQEFIKTQFKLPSKSKNQSFLIHRINKDGSNTISVFNIWSNVKILDHPYNYTPIEINIVGCCNGLVCIGLGQGFVLWNPALKLYKTVSPSKGVFESYGFKVSLGFGYDAEGGNFKVVRIVWLINKINSEMRVSWVEVYSANSDSWTTIDPGFQITKLKIYRINNSAIVNGNPYWVVEEGENKNVLICFDMSKLVFKIVPYMSSLDYNKTKLDIKFVDLNGSLGALVFTCRYDTIIAYVDAWVFGEDTIAYVDAWVFDEGEQIWTKSHSVGPIEVKMNRVLRCLNDGRVLGKRPNGKLTVFNSETKYVRDLFHVNRRFDIYDYTASLAYIQGMEKVKLKERRDHWNKSKLIWRKRRH
ncbi:hypothetical protein CASFOL_027818 [Castilleja foliolosa]|uniref:F-box domain-containing protein n=1 Tax=Castilleja foliolosa TaxID=1961234 RepID=A0ABD3CJG0_9LAMI